MNLVEIAKLLLASNNKRKNNIFFVIPFPWKLLDFFIFNSRFLLKIFQESKLLQILLPIRR